MKTYSLLLITLLLCSCERDAAPLREPVQEVPKNRLDHLIGEYEYDRLVPSDAINNPYCHKYADFDNGFTLVLDSIDNDKRIRLGELWYERTNQDSNVFTPRKPGPWPMVCYENKMFELRMTVNDSGFHLTNRYVDGVIRTVEIHFIKKK